MAEENIPPMPKSSSGLNGCLIGCLIVFLVGFAGAGLVSFFAYQGITGVLSATTETEPRELPPLELTEAEESAASEKYTKLTTAMEQGSDEKEFAFSGDDINAILRSSDHPQVQALGESVYMTIANGELRGEVSLELGRFIPLLKGRYLNGSATFNVSASDGRLFVFIENFQIKGEDAPAEIMSQLRVQNLVQDMTSDPKMREIIEKIEEIRVEEDRLIVTLK